MTTDSTYENISEKTVSDIKDDPKFTAQLDETARRRRSLEQTRLAKKFDSFDWKKAMRVGNCGTFLDFAVSEHVKTHQILRTLEYANFCDVKKFCPQCAWRYSVKTAAEILGRLKKINEDRAKRHLPPLRMIFLTVTVKNVPLPLLHATLSAMGRAWQRFVNTVRFKNSVVGWFRGVEYIGDHTAAGMAHPHFHAILFVTPSYFKSGKYINQAEFTEMWRAAMRADYVPQVNVQIVKPRRKADGTYKSATDSALAEVAKYSVSPVTIEHMTDEDFQLLYEQTKGMRQYAFGGLIAQYEADPPDELDPDEWTYLCTELWRWGKNQYVMKRTEITSKHLPKIG